MCYRYTPSYNYGMKSPFQLMTGRKMKTKLDLLFPKNPQHQQAESESRNEKMENQFNRHHGTKWKEFKVNDNVYYQLHSHNKWKWVQGKITEKLGSVNYQVEIEGPLGTRLVKAHTNQLKIRHGKNEWKDLFEIPDDEEIFPRGEIEPIIIPQAEDAAQENLDESEIFEDAHDNVEEEAGPRYPVRANRGIPPNYLRF